MEKLAYKQLIPIIFISFFTIFSHWNLWYYDIYAFGFNTTLACSSYIALLLYNDGGFSSKPFKENYLWLIPVLLIALSFSLHENPWLKVISIIILPLSICLFFSQNNCLNKNQFIWNYSFLVKLVIKAMQPLSALKFSTQQFLNVAQPSLNSQNKYVFKKVLIGLLILFPLAFLSLILLASADANFGHLINSSLEIILSQLNTVIILKIIFSIMLSILILACFISWLKPWEYKTTEMTKPIDTIVTVIVMSGLFLIYALFLFLQVEYLLVKTLPIDFTKAEHLVKSGFWQLFFLSLINVVLFTVFYKNTAQIAQYFVRIFIATSSLLLLSAAWRMGLYVYYYGLSYEKFFASYTCLFALGIFIVLAIFSFTKEKKNILQLMIIAALWCYSIATILPIEKIIFHANTHLTKKPETRINLSHLRALSIDISNNISYDQPKINGFANQETFQNYGWERWFEKQHKLSCRRPWYENNLSAILQCQ